LSDIKVSLVPDDGQIYLIDSDVLVHIASRNDSALLYEGLIKLARNMRLRSVPQVFGELKKWPSVESVLKEHRETFVIPASRLYDVRVSEFLTILGDKMPSLWEQTGVKNPDPADPWLIAAAASYHYTVVTDESERSPVKIPAACRLPEINCRCIRGPHFLVEVGLVNEVKLEHIDPSRFFNLR
jgi:hypothetical protein